MAFRKQPIDVVLAAAPDATLVVDRHGRIAFASDKVRDTFGYAPAEVLGLQIETLVPERFRDLHVRDRTAFVSTPRARPMGTGLSLYGRHKDGHEFPVEVSLSPLGSGGELQLICAVRDVTHTRKVEEALRQAALQLQQRADSSDALSRQSQEHFRLFVQHAPAAVAMLDRELRYVVVSNRWRHDYGLADRPIVGLRHDELFPQLPDHWTQVYRRGLAGESLQSDEDSIVRADGQLEWLRWELHPWRAADGEIGGIMLFTEVITRRKLAEQALLKSREELEARVAERTQQLEAAKNEALRATALKSRFLAAASHDLRQPLQAAGIHLSVLARRLEQAEQAERAEQAELCELCELVHQPLDAMAGILDVLLDISKLESGAIKVQVRDFNIAPMLERLIADNRPHAEQKGLRLVCEPSDCAARSDPLLLERVIDNFISNAIRYTDQGQVTIRCERSTAAVRVAISDTGRGIPAEALETIFDEYVQLQNPTRDRNKGLGLGLSIAKHIARALDHRIDVQSALGQGSTFSIELPPGAAAAAQAPERRTSARGPGAGAARPEVLIVDDDPAVCNSMRLLLRLAGFAAHGACSGEEALALIQAGLSPQLIVTDLRLPTFDGAELIRRARARLGASLPAVLMTGDVALRSVDASAAGECTVLHKPVNPEQLIAIVEAMAARRHQGA